MKKKKKEVVIALKVRNISNYSPHSPFYPKIVMNMTTSCGRLVTVYHIFIP